MIDSILTSVKKVLGIEQAYTVFDEDIIMHINTVFMSLNQLGVGPLEGFMIIDDNAEWHDFIGEDLNLNAVKTYTYLRVRLLFDPPQTGYLVEALNKQIAELEWRLNVHVDTDPLPVPEVVVDGGEL